MNKEFWDTIKGKSIVKLSLWIIFIGIILIFSVVSNMHNKSDETKEEQNVYEFVTFDKMQEELLNSNYIYSFTVNEVNQKLVFNGRKQDGKSVGYKESSEGIIKYIIDGNRILEDKLGEIMEITNLYNGLEKYLDINLLIESLNNVIYTVDKKEDHRSITYKLADSTIVFSTDTKRINEINIINGDNTYQLMFTYL